MECPHTIWYCSEKYDNAVLEGKVCAECIAWYKAIVNEDDYSNHHLFNHPGMLTCMEKGLHNGSKSVA